MSALEAIINLQKNVDVVVKQEVVFTEDANVVNAVDIKPVLHGNCKTMESQTSSNLKRETHLLYKGSQLENVPINENESTSNEEKVNIKDESMCYLDTTDQFFLINSDVKMGSQTTIKHENFSANDQGKLLSDAEPNTCLGKDNEEADCSDKIEFTSHHLFEEVNFDHKKVKTNYSRKNPSEGRNGKSFSCQQCPKTFTEVLLLKQHEEGHINSQDKLFKCEICSETFTLAGLKRHKVIHNKHNHEPVRYRQFQEDGTPFSCEICKKTFRWRRSLEKHSHVQHTCQTCNKTCPSRYELKLHETTHTGEKNFECHLCKQKFARKHYLRQHLKSHRRIHPRQGADSKQGLKAMCEICDKMISTQGFYQHMKSHVENRFTCKHCDAKFDDEKEFRGHKRLHVKFAKPKFGLGFEKSHEDPSEKPVYRLL